MKGERATKKSQSVCSTSAGLRLGKAVKIDVRIDRCSLCLGRLSALQPSQRCQDWCFASATSIHKGRSASYAESQLGMQLWQRCHVSCMSRPPGQPFGYFNPCGKDYFLLAGQIRAGFQLSSRSRPVSPLTRQIILATRRTVNAPFNTSIR